MIKRHTLTSTHHRLSELLIDVSLSALPQVGSESLLLSQLWLLSITLRGGRLLLATVSALSLIRADVGSQLSLRHAGSC
jgi:hypothetical protein